MNSNVVTDVSHNPTNATLAEPSGKATGLTILFVASLALGCGRGEAATPPVDAGATPPAGSSVAQVVQVDPGLLESGRIRVSKVERRAVDAEASLAGDVVPAEDGQADVGALVAGRIATLDVAEGSRVTKGQVLARIDAPDVGRVTAQLLLARGRLLVAERKLSRQVELEKQGATSRNAIDEARAEDQASRAEVSAARTALAALGAGEPRVAESNAVAATHPISIRIAVRAPIAGVVIDRAAVLGGAVTPEKMLFRIIDPDRLLIRAKVPETMGPLPETGISAFVRPRASAGTPVSTRCETTVVARFGAVDEASRTIPIRLRPEKNCAFLLPGAYVEVLLRRGDPTRQGPAPVAPWVVPADAVVEVRGVPMVFVGGDRPGAFLPRPVRLGNTAGSAVVIEAGLDGDAMVVTSGAVMLKGELLRSALEGG